MTVPVKPAAPESSILMVMREEVFALTFACACVLFIPNPACATAFVAEDAFKTPDALFLSIAGVGVAYYVSVFVAGMHWQNNEDAAAIATSEYSSDWPYSPRRDWLAGRPLPTMEELADACVPIASGPNGSWAMCSTPKDASCEPDELFSDYYGQPVYVCPM